MRRILALALILTASAASAARAQSQAVIGLGVSATTYNPVGDFGHDSTTLGPTLRLKTGKGFGPAIGFSWHSTQMDAAPDATRVYLGRLKVRPVMGGVSYTWQHGRVALVPSLVGGYAFMKLSVNDQVRPVYRKSLGAEWLTFETSNSFAWRGQIAVCYDIAPRVGLITTVVYVNVRPTLSITSDRGVTRSRLDASSTIVAFGFVYGVF